MPLHVHQYRRREKRRYIAIAEVSPVVVELNYVRGDLVERIRFQLASFGLPHYRKRGSWDRRCQAFHTHPTYLMLAQYYHSGFDPAATDRFHQLRAHANAGTGNRNLHSEEAISSYFQRLRDLFESMEHHGYKPGISRDEIGIAIGRNGDLIKVANGNHRMAVARLLGLQSVTVELRFVHEYWFRQCVHNTDVNARNGIAAAALMLPGVHAAR